jgi:hypothetical protein
MEIKKVTPEMRKKLRESLPPEALKKHPTKEYLTSIKAIFVTERLNEVFGIGSWQIRTDLLKPVDEVEKTSSKGRTYKEYTSLLKTTLSIPEYNIYYECIAGSSNDDEGDSTKGSVTDSITKICSWMEIGIDVYKNKKEDSGASPSAPSHPTPKTGELPLMSEEQYKKVVARMETDITAFDKAKKMFNINPTHLSQLETAKRLLEKQPT